MMFFDPLALLDQGLEYLLARKRLKPVAGQNLMVAAFTVALTQEEIDALNKSGAFTILTKASERYDAARTMKVAS